MMLFKHDLQMVQLTQLEKFRADIGNRLLHHSNKDARKELRERPESSFLH